MKTVTLYKEITSVRNLFLAWKVFRRGKTAKRDVMRFEYRLEEHIFKLHRDLQSKQYRHGPYKGFYVTDPKRRHIHKATVRDRVLHHAIYNKLYLLFDPTFISTSFSCRLGKGTHRGVQWLAKTVRKVSHNYTTPCFVLKCDIRKFFDSVDHTILLAILRKRIRNGDVFWLLSEVVNSFCSDQSNLFERNGLPLGNLTSQLLANVYMNEFDQFMKHDMRVRHYTRYTDDFVIVADNEQYLQTLLQPVSDFLHTHLKLTLHPDKVAIHKLHNGVDYLGYVVLPHHTLPRTKTKNRMFTGLATRIAEHKIGIVDASTPECALQSYLGTFSHANAHQASEDLTNLYWFLMND